MNLCGFEVGLDKPIFLISGPCVAESEQMCLDIAGQMKEICGELGIPYIFKASYDKANRSSGKSFRGHGMDAGLRMLEAVKKQLGLPVLTDVHTIEEIPVVASVVDVLQTPAFLCRQTDFIHAVAASGKPSEHQEGPVPRTGRHEERRRQGQGGEWRRRHHHGVRARRVLRLQQPRLRHAFAGDHARHRLSGGVRCHALGAAAGAGRARHRAVSASSCRCWRAQRLP